MASRPPRNAREAWDLWRRMNRVLGQRLKREAERRRAEAKERAAKGVRLPKFKGV